MDKKFARTINRRSDLDGSVVQSADQSVDRNADRNADQSRNEGQIRNP